MREESRLRRRTEVRTAQHHQLKCGANERDEFRRAGLASAKLPPEGIGIFCIRFTKPAQAPHDSPEQIEVRDFQKRYEKKSSGKGIAPQSVTTVVFPAGKNAKARF